MCDRVCVPGFFLISVLQQGGVNIVGCLTFALSSGLFEGLTDGMQVRGVLVDCGYIFVLLQIAVVVRDMYVMFIRTNG